MHSQAFSRPHGGNSDTIRPLRTRRNAHLRAAKNKTSIASKQVLLAVWAAKLGALTAYQTRETSPQQSSDHCAARSPSLRRQTTKTTPRAPLLPRQRGHCCRAASTMGKKEKEADNEPPPLNLNIGVMGHVDSGKTSLVKALSTTLSTASLDRAPQSQARGITLDLGFSSFRAPLPEHLEGDGDLQFTLVDCPGHASLIRTIIGGAQIIDAMVLVVDIIKGVQPQTAECLVIGEITTHDLIIALNKVDQISEEERPAAIEAATKKLRRQLSSSKFKDAPVVACAACVGGEKVAAVGRSELKSESIGLDELVATLRKRARVPKRDTDGPFFFAIDHCFPIRGQGTVVTGTALRGQCRVGDSVELPALGVEKKVKSMQMFRRPAKAIRCGDRAGLCLAQLDAAAIERGVVAAPGSVPGLTAVLALVRKVRFFRGRTDTERTFHVTLGHTTTVATA